jgi:hypothetical protein
MNFDNTPSFELNNDDQTLPKIFILWFFMAFNATYNNISVITWRSVLLVEETGGPGENHRPSQVTDKLRKNRSDI